MPNTPGQGRRAKPTALKVVEGTYRKDRAAENEPVPPEGEIVRPEWVEGRARLFWERHEPILLAMGVLTTADVDTLAVLCEVEAEFWDAREDVRKHGARDNPLVRVASDAEKRLKALQVEFGMSPSSRTRVSAQPKPKEKSALEKLRDRRPG